MSFFPHLYSQKDIFIRFVTQLFYWFQPDRTNKPIPVSYTHLDVYKRQPQLNTTINMVNDMINFLFTANKDIIMY